MGDRRGPAVTAAAACAAVLALGACARLSPVLSPGPFATPAVATATPASSPGDGFTHAERIALRVWARTCDAYRNGSAWMLDATHAVTNRHVVEGATEIELTDYQGHAYTASVAEISPTDDLGLITIDGTFPEAGSLASAEPQPGEAVVATGFAQGGPLAALEGTLLGTRENQLDPDGAPIYSLRMHAEEGNSGSPVADTSGTVVGVLFSSDLDEVAGAVTLTRLTAFLADDARRTEVDATC
ncbi:S1 family peptidase [Demequina gelatinilytica]|uniref:S1 family peptidase n=1 Tax=Demequina gelatinilytica TaxID=1638980 RepID=UPI00078191C0|nr:serine protease [Demequina gelatinilytica]